MGEGDESAARTLTETDHWRSICARCSAIEKAPTLDVGTARKAPALAEARVCTATSSCSQCFHALQADRSKVQVRGHNAGHVWTTVAVEDTSLAAVAGARSAALRSKAARRSFADLGDTVVRHTFDVVDTVFQTRCSFPSTVAMDLADCSLAYRTLGTVPLFVTRVVPAMAVDSRDLVALDTAADSRRTVSGFSKRTDRALQADSLNARTEALHACN